MGVAEAGFNSLIKNDVDVQAVVSDRIYPIKLPQNATYPALKYMVSSADVDDYLDTNNYPPMYYNFEITIYATKYSEVVSISDVLRETFRESDYNIASIEDGKFDDELNTYTRTVVVSLVSLD